jgi:hypothetical protein
VAALAVLPDAARRAARVLVARGVLKLVGLDAQHRAGDSRTASARQEDLRALPEEADSNLVWGHLCPEPSGAQQQVALPYQPPEKLQAALLLEEVSTRPASSKQGLAALWALVEPAERPLAVLWVSSLRVLEPLPVLQAPQAELMQA